MLDDIDQQTHAADDNELELTAEIVSAYVSNNPVPASELPGLIATVAASINQLSTIAPAAAEKPVPAVSIKKSITHDYIICLEDGKTFKSLRRHLSARYGMTPDEYRAKWGLPADYPMVAPGYSAARSEMAKQMGLGRKPEPKPAKRGRKTVA